MAESLHPAVEPIAFLLGTWRGEGKGHYPTIEPFAYGEEISFTPTKKPVVVYSQRTWSLDSGDPLHMETGYWRPLAEGRVEVVLAQAFGLAEAEEGTVAGNRIELTATRLAPTSTAKRIDAISRTFELRDEVLTYTLSMAAVGHALQPHLSAELRRV